MSGSVSVKVRYYDEACGWTERKSSSFAAAVSTPSASAHSGAATTTTTNNNGGGGGGVVVANAPSLLTGAANVASTAAATTAAALLIASKNTMVVCSVDMRHMDMADVERFHELVQLHTPAVAILHAVATPVLARLKSNPYTRKTFAVLEMSRGDQHEECTVVLLRLGLHCDPVEASTKSEGRQATRTLAHIHVRNNNNNNNNNNSGGHGPSLSVSVLNVDANVTPHRRLGIVRSMLYPAASDVVMQVSNITEGLAHGDETYRELQGLRTTAGFSDVLDDAAALPSMLSSSSPSTATATAAAAVGATSTTSVATMTTTWSMWVKSSKYAVVSTTTDLLRGAEPRFIAATVAARTHASATIAIPMPRSGKNARTKSPATGTATATASLHSQATQVLTDPAVLSAEAARTHALHHGSGPASNSSGSSNHHHYSGHNTHALHDAVATAPTVAAATTGHVNKSPHNNMASAALLGGSGGGGGPHASSHHASGSAASASSATHTAATANTGSDLLMRLMRQQQQQQQSSPPPPTSSSSSQHSHTNATPPSARWRLAHSFTLKAGEGKLNGAEAAFDVSNLFSSASEAIDELNLNRLKWPAEFCIVHGTVLCSDAVTHCDRPTFRRYVRDKNNNTLAGKLSAAMNAYTAAAAVARNAERATVVWPKASVSPADASEEAAGTPRTTNTFAAASAATPSATTAANVASGGGGGNGSNNSNASNNNATATTVTAGASAAASAAAAAAAAAAVIQRFVARDEAMVVCREWHESCCTIVYQTTPREMKFNVTKLVGLSKDNLKRAIYLLNRTKTSSKESNPLYDYPYDYALLFSVERQGFWLLAATHVPCDIVACRMVA